MGEPSSTGSFHRLGATIGADAFEPLEIVGPGVSVCAGAVSVVLGPSAAGPMFVGNACRAGASGAEGD